MSRVEPYTPATMREIAERTARGQSETSLAHYLGWDLTQLRTLAKKHGITLRDSGFAMPEPKVELRPRPAIKPPLPEPAAPVALGAPRKSNRISPRRRGDGPRHPVFMNCHVSEQMAREVRDFQKRHDVSRLEAMRRLLAMGLEHEACAR